MLVSANWEPHSEYSKHRINHWKPLSLHMLRESPLSVNPLILS